MRCKLNRIADICRGGRVRLTIKIARPFQQNGAADGAGHTVRDRTCEGPVPFSVSIGIDRIRLC